MCVHACECVQVWAVSDCVSVHMHECPHMYVHVHVCQCVCVYIGLHPCVYLRARVQVSVSSCVCVCMCSIVCLIPRDFPTYLQCLEGSVSEGEVGEIEGFLEPAPSRPTYPTVLN